MSGIESAPAQAGKPESAPSQFDAMAAAALTPEAVVDAIRPVIDPEIGISIVDLGLVYRVAIDPEIAGKVIVDMTLTSPMCPVGPQILQATKFSASMLPGVREVDLRLVWDPAWDPRIHASEETRLRLGIWD